MFCLATDHTVQEQESVQSDHGDGVPIEHTPPTLQHLPHSPPTLNTPPTEHVEPEDQRFLKAAILGLPNSGKSTLVNHLIGQKVSEALNDSQFTSTVLAC